MKKNWYKIKKKPTKKMGKKKGSKKKCCGG